MGIREVFEHLASAGPRRGGRARDGQGYDRLALDAPTQAVSTPDADVSFMRPVALGRAGRLVLVGFIAVLLGWAAFAPLQSAVVAPGVVVVETHEKQIQHLESGIVRRILVTEGQAVQPGQPLLELDDTQTRASVSLLEGQIDELTAEEARMVAERDGASTVAFPTGLLSKDANAQAKEAVRGNRRVFVVRREILDKQTAILQQRTKENDRIIAGMQGQIEAIAEQEQLIGQETAAVQKLYDQGLSPLPRLLALKREAASLKGQRNDLTEKIEQVRLSSGENDKQILNTRSQTQKETLDSLQDVQAKRFEALDRLRSQQDVLSRLNITSPVAGRVADLSVHTVGAVITPGQVVMKIIPAHDALEIEVHIRPQDVDQIHPGMAVRISLVSYDARNIAPMNGTVRNVSADRLVDQRTGEPSFVVLVAVERSGLTDVQQRRLKPGIPVNVAFATGARTALSYLFEPISDVMRKGMRER